MGSLAGLNKENGVTVPQSYGRTPNDNLHWDGESIYGCACDEGFTGYDCSRRTCPRGDDPYTGRNTVDRQYNEVRHFKCVVDPGQAGTFKLVFRDATSESISHLDTAAMIKEKLEGIISINSVSVEFSSQDHLTMLSPVCTEDGSNVVKITFNTETGGSTYPDMLYRKTQPSLPSLDNAEVSSTLTITRAETDPEKKVADLAGNDYVDVIGTKEFNVCADRGICDFTTGICNCFTGYGSSNGLGGEGKVGDCGYVEPYVTRSG